MALAVVAELLQFLLRPRQCVVRRTVLKPRRRATDPLEELRHTNAALRSRQIRINWDVRIDTAVNRYNTLKFECCNNCVRYVYIMLKLTTVFEIYVKNTTKLLLRNAMR